jgi:hypothetical protein
MVLVAFGCTDRPGPSAPPVPAASNPDVEAQLAADLSRIVNDATIRNAPLDYDYDEDLLTRIDQIEAHLAGGDSPGSPPPRFMPKLTAEEELDHFRETIRQWEARTGRKLRAAIDPLKAEVAARAPDGPRYHPDFHKRFSAIFDEFIKLEITDMQRRRNREIHAKAAELLETYRPQVPELVRTWTETLNRQYPLSPEPPAQSSSQVSP